VEIIKTQKLLYRAVLSQIPQLSMPEIKLKLAKISTAAQFDLESAKYW